MVYDNLAVQIKAELEDFSDPPRSQSANLPHYAQLSLIKSVFVLVIEKFAGKSFQAYRDLAIWKPLVVKIRSTHAH